jgi:hypothetical protein
MIMLSNGNHDLQWIIEQQDKVILARNREIKNLYHQLRAVERRASELKWTVAVLICLMMAAGVLAILSEIR